MNQKKAKALRRMAERIANGKPQHAYKEMGMNFRQIEKVDTTGKLVKQTFPITATLSVAADTVKGQYKALKKIVKAEYGWNKL